MNTQKTTEHQHGKVCPWWVAYSFDNWITRTLDPPERNLKPWIEPGMAVMDFGCGLGRFSLAAARLLRGQGRVIAVDLQDKMLEIAEKRAAKAGLAKRMTFVKCSAHDIGHAEPVDFIVTVGVLHETPDHREVLQGFHELLQPGGRVYFSEPRMHARALFDVELATAREVGFAVEVLPPTFGYLRALLTKAPAGAKP